MKILMTPAGKLIAKLVAALPIAVSILVIILASGCGHRGALVLPPEKQETDTAQQAADSTANTAAASAAAKTK